MSEITVFITPTNGMSDAFKTCPMVIQKVLFPEMKTIDITINKKSGLSSNNDNIFVKIVDFGSTIPNSDKFINFLEPILTRSIEHSKIINNSYLKDIFTIDTLFNVISFVIKIKKLIVKKALSKYDKETRNSELDTYIHNLIYFLSKYLEELKLIKSNEHQINNIDKLVCDPFIAVFQLARKTYFNPSEYLKRNDITPKEMRQYLKIIIKYCDFYYTCDNNLGLLKFPFIHYYLKKLAIGIYNKRFCFEHNISKLLKIITSINKSWIVNRSLRKYFKRNIIYGNYLLNRNEESDDYYKSIIYKNTFSEFINKDTTQSDYEKWFDLHLIEEIKENIIPSNTNKIIASKPENVIKQDVIKQEEIVKPKENNINNDAIYLIFSLINECKRSNITINPKLKEDISNFFTKFINDI